MNQINVSPPPVEPRPVETVDGSGDRTTAAGINLITVLIVCAVLLVVAWYLFAGPLRGLGSGGTNVNVNIPAQPAPTITINVTPPAQPGGNGPGTGGNNPPGQPPPAKP